MKLLSLSTALVICMFATASGSDSPSTNHVAKPVEIAGVHNAFRVTERIYSGSQPEGDAAFEALKKLGIKTIISVDGSKPDIEAARKFGLKYVHLPIGYDGVATNRLAELTKVTSEGSGPYFVHCHHGKHRGPAAVAVMCEASEGWTAEKAVAFMHQAGTGDDYPGLYRSAHEFKAPTAAQLAAVKELPEIAKTPSLVDAMVAIDEHFDSLKKCQAAGWKTPLGAADISPAQEATILWEAYKEIARTPDAAKRPEEFRVKLSDAEKSMDALRLLLQRSESSAALDPAFQQAGQSCTACHKKYRN